jgi:uncharacterized protein (DUF433 family)
MEPTADIVVSDPAVLGGEPVFRGTRVPVQALIDCLAAGDSVDSFLDDFPSVPRDAALTVLRLAGEYLRAQAGRM